MICPQKLDTFGNAYHMLGMTLWWTIWYNTSKPHPPDNTRNFDFQEYRSHKSQGESLKSTNNETYRKGKRIIIRLPFVCIKFILQDYYALRTPK